jgi:hypothetical protein
MELKALVPWKGSGKSQVPAPREEFLDPFVAFRREVDRMLNGFFDGFGRSGGSSLTGWSVFCACANWYSAAPRATSPGT